MSLTSRSIKQGRLLSRRCGSWLLRACFSSGRPAERVSNNLRFHECSSGGTAEDRPLVLLYSWLVAKAQHMHKFGDFYLNEGCDVLHIKLRPGELMWPRKAHTVVKQILDFAQTERPHQPIIAHGFSVGCYLYAETLTHILNDARYTGMADRLCAQVLDSPVDYHGVPFGVANVLSQQPIVQKAIELSIRTYLATFQQSVTQHFERASQTIRGNALMVPSLVLYSRADVVADCAHNEASLQEWHDNGITVQSKCWPDSVHVGHYLKYPTEYIEILSSFLQQLHLLDEKKTNERSNSTKPDVAIIRQ